MTEIYNSEYYQYYRTDCGSVSYENEEIWSKGFSYIAERIVQDFHPKTVLDAGCAMGYLVAALRDLGVDAYGLDISEYAISKVREDVQPYCFVGSLADTLPDGLPKSFDLVVTMEVLEHLNREDGKKAIGTLCTLSDKVLFTSTSTDIVEYTHINVQQKEYWAEIFAEQGFFHELLYKSEWLTTDTVLYKKGSDYITIIGNYERLLRQKALLATETQTGVEYSGNVYFNFGNGESEDHVFHFSMKEDAFFQQRIDLPLGCRSLRFDPVEGTGVLVSELEVRGETQMLQVKEHNGMQIKDSYLFTTIDPQIYVEGLEGERWVEISARIKPVSDSIWLKTYAYLTELKNEIACSQENNERYLTELKNLQAEAKAYVDALEEKEAECSKKICEITNEYAEDLERANSQLMEAEEKAEAHRRETIEYSNLVAYEHAQAQQISAALLAIQNSTTWRITKPFRWCLDQGKKLMVLPKKFVRSLKNNGVKLTIKKVKVKLFGGTMPVVALSQMASVNAMQSNRKRSAVTGHPIDPIETILMDESVKRLNLVTDTINADSLLGGVATALIVATEFANRFGYELRIITRNAESNPMDYENILRINGIKPADKVSFYSDFDRFMKDIDFKLDITEGDIFFATSWWSAKAISETTIRKRFFYILQEVETFFYNYGGEHLLCAEMMNHKDIDFIVNSKYLFDYFQSNEANVVNNGCYFEPAFSDKLYHKPQFSEKEHYRLFFYARPNNPRNLYTVGVEFLKKAVEKGILDTDRWDIYLVGQDADVITFSNGYTAINKGRLSWQEYAEFLQDVDLGLCLMYTPHPSYPPYDVACSGGVVLSNRMLNKTEFGACRNVIFADLDEDVFMESFAEAIALAENTEQRKRNYEENTISRNWNEALGNVMEFMEGRSRNV